MNAVIGHGNSRLTIGLFASLGGFAVIGLSGLLMNLIIAFHMGSDALGIFNQALAVYIFLSQLCAFGIHNSALAHIAQRPKRNFVFINSAISLVFIISLICAGLLWYFIEYIEVLFDSKAVAQSCLYLVPALVLFSINKLALALLNGLNRIVSYNLFASLRYIIALIAIWWLASSNHKAEELTFAILIGEISVTTFALPYTLIVFRHVNSIRNGDTFKTFDMPFFVKWCSRHLSYGGKSFLGNSIIELNSRIDIVMLGIFLDDRLIGIYVMASTIAEGFAQLPVFFRININPLLARAFKLDNLQTAIDDLSNLRWWFFVLMISGACLLVMGYYGLLLVSSLDDDFMSSLPILAILAASIAASSRYLPFNQIFMMCNNPWQNSILFALILIINAIGNLFLIPVFGILGAALGTAISVIFSAIAIKLFATKYLSIKL